jgi:hypothetical protein
MRSPLILSDRELVILSAHVTGFIPCRIACIGPYFIREAGPYIILVYITKSFIVSGFM